MNELATDESLSQECQLIVNKYAEGAQCKLSQMSQADGSEVPAWHYECEWTLESDAEADFHLKQKNCKKNPGHKNFIPIGQFDIEHLPPEYQDEDIVEWVKLTAVLTVKVCVKYTSRFRPKTCLDYDTEEGIPVPGCKDTAGKPYPFSAFRGSTSVTRAGTACVWEIPSFNKKCKCKSNCLEKTGGFLWLCTARHVVYDDSEAEQVELIFNYDNEGNQENRKRVLKGKVQNCNTETDVCVMSFWSHDMELVHKLVQTLERRRVLKKKLNSKYSMKLKPEQGDALGSNFPYDFPVITVSHPHGCSKMVTVGRCTEILGDQAEKTVIKHRRAVFKYTADTCPGSSGAQLFCADWKGGYRFNFVMFPSHSAGSPCGVNRSAAWGRLI